MEVRLRRGWGWLLLVTLTLSTIGDEISLITLMFRTASDRTAFAVPMLLVAELLPGLPDVAVVAREPDDRHLGAWMAGLPALADAGATLVLTGKAQTIQRLKAGLKALGVPSSRTMSKAYWTPGKTGLD